MIELSHENTLMEKQGEKSLKHRDLKFLLEAPTDRSSFESAEKSIEPLSDIEDLASTLGMTKTATAIRSVINRVEQAITAEPNPIMKALGLSDAQKELVESVTAAEVLKFSMLNSMDAVRLLVVNEFKKNIKFFNDQAVIYNVVAGPGGTARVSQPQSTPFSNAKAVSPYEIYLQGRSYMIIGPETSGDGVSVTIPVPGRGGLPLSNVTPGKIYITGRDSDGEPMPIQDGLKNLFLKVSTPSKGSLVEKLSVIAGSPTKGFNLEDVITRNFKVPAPAEGTIVSIYRAIRKNTAIRPATSTLNPAEFAAELGELTLENFKKFFSTMVEKTSNATGDMTTYDLADTLFFTGLASVSGMLGTTPPPGPAAGAAGGGAGPGAGAPPPPSSGAAGAAGAAGAGGGGGSGGGGGPGGGGGGGARHSLGNILSDPRVALGASAAERSTNLATLNTVLNQDQLRRSLNALTGGSVIFTEGAVDRWCELAGIKEGSK